MKSPAYLPAGSSSVFRRRFIFIGAALLVGFAIHGFVMRQAAKVAISWAGKLQGYEVQVGDVSWNVFSPMEVTDLSITGGGTELRIARAEVAWSALTGWGESPKRWVERLSLQGVRGTWSLVREEVKVASAPGEKGSGPISWLPRTVEAEIDELRVLAWKSELAFTDAQLMLSEDRAGWLKVAGTSVDASGWKKDWKELSAVTAWRGGVAYVADLALAENAKIDTLSVATIGESSVTMGSSAFGGYLYAALSRDAGGAGVKCSLTVLNMSLADAGVFAGVADKMEGGIDLAKLTFNGTTTDPLSGQLAVRFEAREFGWQKRAFHECNVGLSLAGRRLRLNEFLLTQKNNRIKASGLVEFPQKREAWREAPFEMALDADVRDVRAVAELIGGAWKESSGSLRMDGQASGKLGEGDGWLLARGWNLRLRGVPVNSLEAGVQMNRSNIKISGFEAWSGRNFLRASGEIALAETPAYRGRLEMRVGEVAGYLEPLGRFAPDWAREGGVLLFWDGDGSAGKHSGVTTLELVQFSGDLNPVPVNVNISATYSPENLYLGRCLLTRGPLSLSTVSYFGPEGLAVEDLQVFNGRTRLLKGDLFLPLSFSAVLERKPWRDVINPASELKATVRSDDLELGAVARLFGQQSPIRGRVDWKLDARGKWTDAELESRLAVSGLRAEFPSFAVPESRLEVAAKVAKRNAELKGKFIPEGGKPIEASAVLPLMGEAPDGRWTLLDRAAPWDVKVDLPATDIAAFALRNGRVKFAAGKINGRINLGNTPAEPVWSGALELRDGRCELPDGWRPIHDIRAMVSFDGGTAKFDDATARSGSGKWSLEGSVDAKDWRALKYDLAVKGAGVEMFRNEIADLRGTVDMQLRGDKDQGVVRGDWNLAGSRLLRGLSVNPHAQADEKSVTKLAAPFRAMMQPFAAWEVDLRVHADGGLSVGTKESKGSWRPDMHLTGTLGAPLLTGSINVTDFAVKFPSATLRVARGAVSFTKENPWMPQLNLAATGEVGGYEVRAGASGALDEGKLMLTSVPPLPSEQVLALLHKGSLPLAAPVPPVLDVPTQNEESVEPLSWLGWHKIVGLIRKKSPQAGEATPAVADEWAAQGGVVGYDWTLR